MNLPLFAFAVDSSEMLPMILVHLHSTVKTNEQPLVVVQTAVGEVAESHCLQLVREVLREHVQFVAATSHDHTAALSLEGAPETEEAL